MTANARLTVSWTAVVVGAVGLLVVGGGATYLVVGRTTRTEKRAVRDDPSAKTLEMPGLAPRAAAVPGQVGAGALPAILENTPLPDVAITLTPEAVARAGIAVTPVTAGDVAERVRIPGVVQANAYRQVAVTPLVAGRVTRVAAALGDRVRRGQILAQVYSPELADAQTQYVSLSAELDAAHQALRRTERLVEIGAASRQELEKITAEHTAHQTRVESARSKLVLLGMTSEQVSRLSSAAGVSATTIVPAPIDGVVTEREANAGLNVDPSMKLFTIVDLSTVWIVGDLYEKDFALVHVGAAATIGVAAYPDLTVRGRVSYIAPQVSSDTRTAQVRVEVANPAGRLRLGMYTDMKIEGDRSARATMLPKTAVQNVGNRQVVYLADPKQPGRFIEREVHLASEMGDQVQATAGVVPGDRVVSAGSFYLRAEGERLGLRQDSHAARQPAP